MAIENITGNESVEELQQLYAVAENRLRMLDEKRSYTKPEIYQKVRAEYESKLFELRVLLEEKGAGLQEALDAALVEKEALVTRHHQIGDELEELELRAVIGEVDEASFASKQQALQQELAGIDAALEELSARIENYQQLVGCQAAPAPEPEPAPAPVEPPPAPRPVPVQPAIPARLVPAITPMVPQRSPVAPVPVSAPEPVPMPARPAPQPVMPPRPAVPLAAAPKPVPAPRPVPPVPEPPAPAAPVDIPPAASVEMDELERQFASILSNTMADSAPMEKPAMDEVFSPGLPAAAEAAIPEPAPETPADVESHEGELKCPKCAAFNRADNWYCEKCGNELLSATDLLGGTK